MAASQASVEDFDGSVRNCAYFAARILVDSRLFSHGTGEIDQATGNVGCSIMFLIFRVQAIGQPVRDRFAGAASR